MRCPHCQQSTLHSQPTRQGSTVEVCSQCHGLWMEAGQIYEFSSRPRDLEARLEEGSASRHASARLCPRCNCNLEEETLPEPKVQVDSCPGCGGLWFDAGEVERVVQSSNLPILPDELEAEPDVEAREKARERHHALGAGLLALPNLLLRSVLTLVFLYGLLTLVLIALVQFRVLSAGIALAIAVVFAVLQYTFGPWLMDLSLRWVFKFRWVEPDQLPEHLEEFVERVCGEQRLRFPYFGLIDDGAPTAFTYGHHPNNARVVISRGLIELLEPAELEAVVAHELGHVRNWDMALMTVANLVPFILFYIYRVAIRLGDRGKKEYTWVVYIGAYVLYVISQYIVLWFSRTREYFADRFSGKVTGNPNALARALVKIAYGLAAQVPAEEKEKGEETGKKKKKKAARPSDPYEAVNALNIFDRKAAVSLVTASATGTDAAHLDAEQVKGAMQWDLWNPWALYYELHSTHPLVAKRLLYLSDQAAHQGQEPFIIFDRRQPESYWDDFVVDLFMMVLPTLCFLLGIAAFIGTLLLAPGIGPVRALACLAGGIALAGIGSLIKTHRVYRKDFFPHLSIAALLHKVKVSAVRPVPATVTGTVIGKGVPGLIWSEDFVLKDRTGILFLNYRQPLALWNWLFGLLRAERYQGKEVRVRGWYRRSPVPYLEIYHLDVVDGSQPSRNCYSYHGRVVLGVLLLVVGILGAVTVCLL